MVLLFQRFRESFAFYHVPRLILHPMFLYFPPPLSLFAENLVYVGLNSQTDQMKP